MNNLPKFTDYTKGLLLEKGKKYSQALHSYKIAVEQYSPYRADIYYRLAYLLDRRKEYRDACDNFLLIDKIEFELKINTPEENSKNIDILYQYLLTNQPRTEKDWFKFAQKAEDLRCWSIATYAYKEVISRADNFISSYYKSLGYSLMQEEKYKEASKYFKEQKQIQSIKRVIQTQKDNDIYQDYKERFSLEEKIILYESDNSISDRVYELYLDIDKDAHFNSYRHVWAVDNRDNFDKHINLDNSIIIQRDSDLYKRYLSKAKYIISNREALSYYERKEQQYYIFTEENNTFEYITHNIDSKTSNYDIIQEVFFGNGLVASKIIQRDTIADIFYNSAIDDFNNKKWKEAYDKFIEVKKRAKDIKFPLPTNYYISESKFQLDVKHKKIEELLVYEQYKLNAKTFAGLEYCINRAKKESNNKDTWEKIYNIILTIIEDIKRNTTTNIRAIKDKTFLNKIEELSKYFEDDIEAKLLPYQIWFLISHLFIFARLYKKYQLAREKALESVLLNDNIPNRYKIVAMAEKSMESEYNTLRDTLLKDSNPQYIKEHLEYLGATELYFNRQKSTINFYKSIYTEKEKKFADYIKDKSIAIVGPLKSDLNLGEEIDSHDIVIRFNYKGLDKSLKASHGAKTNVSFYIVEILVKDRIDAKQISYMNELDWVIADMWHKEDNLCFTGLKSNLRLRYFDANEYANPYFKGTTNGIQRILLDILRFDVGKIKIYNSNLFLDNSYEKSYKSRGTLGADHLNFIWHDPLSNFIFLKRLKEYNIIDVDSILENILKLTPSEYINEIENRYR